MTALKNIFADFFVNHEAVVLNKIRTIPNLITGLGILLTFWYGYQFMTATLISFIPLTVFAIGLSDFFDGLAARVFSQHSKVGKIIDPLRDRLLATMMLFNVVWVGGIAVLCLIWLLAIVICECTLGILGIFYMKRGGIIRVHTIGKIRQLVHLLCIMIFLVQLHWLGSPLVNINTLLAVMAAASFATFIAYIIRVPAYKR